MVRPVMPSRSGSASGQRPSLRQKGVALVVVLMGMIALLIASIALLRSVDIANMIAGNFTFRKAATSAADLGIEAAYTALPTMLATSADQNIPGQYFATLTPAYGGLTWDANGLPPASVWTDPNVPVITNSGNTIKYIVERLCIGSLPVASLQLSCTSTVATNNGSLKSGNTSFTANARVHYRVTVQVTGPRNTMTYIQTIIAI